MRDRLDTRNVGGVTRRRRDTDPLG